MILSILVLICQVPCDMQVEVAVDIQQRYVGHCNTGTDIKQASFLGEKGHSLLFPTCLSESNMLMLNFFRVESLIIFKFEDFLV